MISRLIIDDPRACDIVEQSGATLVGIGAVIEKAFEGGRGRVA